MSVSEKIIVTNKADIGKHGPGKYVLMNTAKNLVKKVITVLGTESKVDESQGDLTDVSKLLEPAIRKGLLRHSVHYAGEYDDIPSITYQDALDTTTKVEEMFESLPPQIRTRFQGKPGQFLDYVQNPDNYAEMQKLGMTKGVDGRRADGSPSGAPTDFNNDGNVDTVDTNADGIPDAN